MKNASFPPSNIRKDTHPILVTVFPLCRFEKITNDGEGAGLEIVSVNVPGKKGHTA